MGERMKDILPLPLEGEGGAKRRRNFAYKIPLPPCLGFAPRSESFAIEPTVQLRSISSLSGLISFRPSANPLYKGVSLRHSEGEARKNPAFGKVKSEE